MKLVRIEPTSSQVQPSTCARAANPHHCGIEDNLRAVPDCRRFANPQKYEGLSANEPRTQKQKSLRVYSFMILADRYYLPLFICPSLPVVSINPSLRGGVYQLVYKSFSSGYVRSDFQNGSKPRSVFVKANRLLTHILSSLGTSFARV